MERLDNTIEGCRKIAEKYRHNIGDFVLYALSPEVCFLLARCQNEKCDWVIFFDVFGRKVKDKHGNEYDLVVPNYPLFCSNDCQAFNKTAKEREKISAMAKVAEEMIQLDHPGSQISWYMDLPPMTNQELLLSRIGSAEEYLSELDEETRRYRLQRKEELGDSIYQLFTVIHIHAKVR